jgi:hypothetical protein
MPREYFGNLPIVAGMTFTRDVLYLDDCEGTCNWSKTATDANATITHETAAALMGTYGLQLYSGDADPAEDDVVSAVKVFGHSGSDLLICRLRVASPEVGLWKTIDLKLQCGDGTEYYLATLRWSIVDAKVYYLNSAGTYTAIAALAQTTQDNQWLTLELAIDLGDHQYLSITINGNTADLTGTALQHPGASSNRYTQLTLTGTVAGAAAATAYFDMIYLGEILQA